MCALWLAEAFTATHTPGDTANHGRFTPSYLICMCFSARQNMLANQICVLCTCKSCPIVGELASSQMEGIPTHQQYLFSKSPYLSPPVVSFINYPSPSLPHPVLFLSNILLPPTNSSMYRYLPQTFQVFYQVLLLSSTGIYISPNLPIS